MGGRGGGGIQTSLGQCWPGWGSGSATAAASQRREGALACNRRRLAWLPTCVHLHTPRRGLTRSCAPTPLAALAQAVAKGDAAAVAKKAAEDARAAQEAQVDALFASDEEDEDYNPEVRSVWVGGCVGGEWAG